MSKLADYVLNTDVINPNVVRSIDEEGSDTSSYTREVVIDATNYNEPFNILTQNEDGVARIIDVSGHKYSVNMLFLKNKLSYDPNTPFTGYGNRFIIELSDEENYYYSDPDPETFPYFGLLFNLAEIDAPLTITITEI